MQKYQDAIVNGSTGRPVTGASVAVAVLNGGAATIYSDNGVTQTSNPLTSDSNGRFSFYAADGRYSLAITGAGITATNVSDILLEDPVDGSSALAASGGSALVGFLPSGTGAIARTVQGRLRDTVHLYDFLTAAEQADVQARTDLNDLTTAIGRALTQATGSALYVPYGTYLAGSLTIPNSTRITGDGARTTTIKMKASTNGNLLANASGKEVVIEGLTLDGNSGSNSSGRCISFTTDSVTDGPALVMRDVVITGGPLGSGDNSSAFFSGLNWMHLENIRYVNNKGTLWLSINDSDIYGLYAGNSGVVANVPCTVIGGGSNAFFGPYWGGNGASTGSTASQVQFIGAAKNTFYGARNDSANGSAYEFIDNGATYSKYNQFIGGLCTNPSQNATNTYYHFYYHEHSSNNEVIGGFVGNTAAKVGKFGFAEAENATGNTHKCQLGTFGTAVSALIGSGSTPSRILDSIGYNPQGCVSESLTASPMTYTNTYNVRVALYIYGGTVSAVVKNGITISTTTNCTIWLEPGESVTITYSVNPVITADKK